MTTSLGPLPLSPKQIDFLQHATYKVNVAEGAVRAGKTFIVGFSWLLFVAHAPTGGALVMAGRTRDSVYRNVIAELQKPELYGAMAKQVRYTPGAPTATIFGRIVHVMGAHDIQAEMVIRGLTVAGAYVDEITVVHESFFKQLLSRMSVRGARLYGTTNPDSPAHWLKTGFLDRLGELRGWRRWHFVMDDNPDLSEQFKADMRAQYTGMWYRRYVQGEWVTAGDAVFDLWDPDRHIIQWANLPPMQEFLAVGVDYGTTNPTAAVLLGVTQEYDEYNNLNPRLIAVDEWGYTAKSNTTRWTNTQLSAGLREWLNEPHTPQPSKLKPRFVFVDPSAEQFSTQLRFDGLTPLDADNSVHYGISLIANLLARGKLLVSDRCTSLIGEFPGYSWDDKAKLRGEEKPVKVADHWLDALRYSVVTTENMWRNDINLYTPTG